MRVEQLVYQPCSFCVLVMQLDRLSKRDREVYQRHLRAWHHLQPYYIQR